MSDGVDELPITDERGRVRPDEFVVSGQLYAEYRRLIAEQAALRRLAALVARGVDPMEVFGAVAEEMRRCVPADTAGLWRFESDGAKTLVAAAAHPAAHGSVAGGHPIPGGWQHPGNAGAAHRPARADRQLRQCHRADRRSRACGRCSAAVGVPIFVDGHVRGLAAVGSMRRAAMPADTEVAVRRAERARLASPCNATNRNGSYFAERRRDRHRPRSAPALDAICRRVPANTSSLALRPRKSRRPELGDLKGHCRASLRVWPTSPWSCRKSRAASPRPFLQTADCPRRFSSWPAAHRSRCSLTLPSANGCLSPSRSPPTTWWLKR